MKFNYFALLAATAAALTACGGGGGGDAGIAPQTPVTVSSSVDSSRLGFSGSVSAPLNTTDIVTLFVTSGSNGSTKDQVTQDSKGAIVKFGGFSLGGDYGVQEIAGNSSFALGRWSAGDQSVYDPIAKVTATENLLKYTNGSTYYVTLHQPKTALANFNGGAVNACTETYITKPKNTNGLGDSFARSFSIQNGTVKFDTIGNAAVEFTINVADSKSSGTTTFLTDIRWLQDFGVYNGFNVLGLKGQTSRSDANGFVQLGTNTTASVLVGGIYTIKLSSNALYTGSFAIVCK